MHYARTREVDIAVAQIQSGADLRQPPSTPSPAAGNRVQDRADEKFTKQECPERDALANGADNDVAGSLHEHDFEKGQAVAARVIGRTGKKESLAADESPLTASYQKMIERRDAAKIGGSGIDGNGSELKCISDREIGQEGEHVGSEVQHHQVRGILFSNQPAREQGKTCLHEKDEVTCIQGPGKVRGHADVPHAVS